jgi:protease PrsW
VTVLLLAAVPTFVYSYLIWWLDRYEHEPLHLLAVAFVWGAAPALVLALLVELGVGWLAGGMLQPGMDATLVAPLVEEPAKALALIGLFLFVRREFNGLLDGIIYGALVGFGFAMSENVLYLLGSPEQVMVVWVLRSIVFGLNHAFYSSIVGIALGLVRYDRRRWVGYIAVPLGLLLAMVAHAIHNASVQVGLAGLCVAWLVDSGGVLVVLAVALLAQRHERHWVQTQLGPELAMNIIAPDDLRVASTPSVRFQREWSTLFRRGWLQFRHRRRFHHLLIELAFAKHQVFHNDRHCRPEDVEKLRTAVVAQRALVQQP